jgi:hypothetical protein
MSDADWIVLRFKREVPVDQVPPELEGKWLDRSCLGETYAAVREVEPGPSVPDVITRHTVARPTGRFETDEEMNVAEVWEVENWGLAS